MVHLLIVPSGNPLSYALCSRKPNIFPAFSSTLSPSEFPFHKIHRVCQFQFLDWRGTFRSSCSLLRQIPENFLRGLGQSLRSTSFLLPQTLESSSSRGKELSHFRLATFQSLCHFNQLSISSNPRCHKCILNFHIQTLQEPSSALHFSIHHF